jgi:hypothetical protein
VAGPAAPKRTAAKKAAGKKTAAKAPARKPVATRTPPKSSVVKTPPRAAAPKPAPVLEKPVRQPPPPPKPKSSIRLGGSSRLTIKPGPPGALRPTLTLSTKQRPGGPRPLSEVELDEDEVLIDGFDAMLDGVRVRITAVLERTCVYVDRAGDRRLASKKDLVVEADKLPIRRRGLG